MNEPAANSLYTYYLKTEVLPTFGSLRDEADLARYTAQRITFFRDKLLLPPRLFNGAKVVEFGPDTGENALVFAGWGADLTLIEPNPRAWDYIRAYFERFGRGERLKGLIDSSVERFASTEPFDLVVAEGFIYTVRPVSQWLGSFSRLLKPDGYFVISHCDTIGGFWELFLKVLVAAVVAQTGESHLDAAKRLYAAKWDSIPHTRAFESWVMDVIENPYVRLKWLLGADHLCREVMDSDFAFHTTWPNYLDGMAVYWHKRELARQTRFDTAMAFIKRARLGHFFGKKLFLCAEDFTEIERVDAMLGELVAVIDGAIDRPEASALEQARGLLAGLAKVLAEQPILADEPDFRAANQAILASADALLALAAKGDIDGLCAATNSDPVFIATWGQPLHFAVCRKEGDHG